MIGTYTPLIKSIAERLYVKPKKAKHVDEEATDYIEYEDIFLALLIRIEALEERVTNMELGI